MLGKPIIMAQNTGYDDVIRSKDIGILTEYSKDGIVHAIHDLVNRTSDWKTMGERAQRLYDEVYSWRIMQQRIEEIYRDL